MKPSLRNLFMKKLTRGEAPFPEEVAMLKKGNHSFLTPVRHDRQLNRAFLYVEDGVSGIALRKDTGIPFVGKELTSGPGTGEEILQR